LACPELPIIPTTEDRNTRRPKRFLTIPFTAAFVQLKQPFRLTARMTEQAKNDMLSLIPTQRLGTVDDISSAVAFLVSPLASYITGQVLQVNGGLLMP